MRHVSIIVCLLMSLGLCAGDILICSLLSIAGNSIEADRFAVRDDTLIIATMQLHRSGADKFILEYFEVPSGLKRHNPAELGPWFLDKASWLPSCCLNMPDSPDRGTSVVIESRGWPLPLAWCKIRSDENGNWRAQSWSGIRYRANSGAEYWDDLYIIPVRPIVANVILFVLVTMPTLALGRGALVRIGKYVRRKRGRCEFCGYDLQQISANVCPECGSARRCCLG